MGSGSSDDWHGESEGTMNTCVVYGGFCYNDAAGQEL